MAANPSTPDVSEDEALSGRSHGPLPPLLDTTRQSKRPGFRPASCCCCFGSMENYKLS